jgi:hypothetical protein
MPIRFIFESLPRAVRRALLCRAAARLYGLRQGAGAA